MPGMFVRQEVKQRSFAAAAAGGIGRVRSFLWARRVPLVLLAGPLVLVGVLCWPLLFTDATFHPDWLNHLWYMWHQSLQIRSGHLPSLYLNYPHGLFYPIYAFYGGTLYALVGALSLVFGDAPLETYLATYVLGFLAAYGGWYWLSRTFGLGRWLAQVPGMVFITSATYLTTLYSLGDWPEFLAVSMMPLMVASGIAILRSERLEFPQAAALTVSTIIFSGSHLLTAIWGTAVLGIVCVVILAGVPEARHSLSRRRLGRLTSVVISAVLVNAWFLIPAAVYESQTAIAKLYLEFRTQLRAEMYLVAAKQIFALSRPEVDSTLLRLSLPVLAMIWVVAGAVIAYMAGRRSTWMRVLLSICAVTIVLIVAMTHAAIILALPRMFATLQFSFRLENFVVLGVSGATLAVLVLNRGGERNALIWRWALPVVLIVAVVQAVTQVSNYRQGPSRSETALTSFQEAKEEHGGLLGYIDGNLRAIPQRLPSVEFPLKPAANGRVEATVTATLGERVETNLKGWPAFVHISGARIVGANKQDQGNVPVGSDILEVVPPTATTSTRNATSSFTDRITVSTADPWPMVLGGILTGVGVAALLLLGFLLPAFAAVRRRWWENAEVD